MADSCPLGRAKYSERGSQAVAVTTYTPPRTRIMNPRTILPRTRRLLSETCRYAPTSLFVGVHKDQGILYLQDPIPCMDEATGSEDQSTDPRPHSLMINASSESDQRVERSACSSQKLMVQFKATFPCPPVSSSYSLPVACQGSQTLTPIPPSYLHVSSIVSHLLDFDLHP